MWWTSYKIPTVKVTGGQRIDLLGVRKEQLPDVWRDLNAAGMVSGHAYGKALRTVKTCVGSEWCRFGTQDSTAMGIALEKMTWGSWTPHKTKMAVSGCPRNCAEATIKDFGVIATESGWDLLCRRQRRHQGARHRPAVQGHHRGRGAGIRRRLHAGLPRGGLVSGTHRALGGARRHRLRPRRG